jgi:membrane-associated protein
MPFKAYTAYNVLGAVLWIWSMLFVGYFLGRYIPGVERHIEKVIILVIFLSLLPGLISWYRNRSKTQALDASRPTGDA